MVLLSFSGEPKRGAFYMQISRGEKTTTIRKLRKRPIKKGDILHLYWKVRQAIGTKPIHFIGKAICVDEKILFPKDFLFDIGIARADGFMDDLEMRIWFQEVDPQQKYQWIKFKLM